MNRTVWTILFVTFLLAFIVIAFVTFRITNQMIRPVTEATTVANELAKGNFKARTVEGKLDEVGELARSINVLAYNLDQITKRHQVQQERLETLIQHIGSGLIFINIRGDISLINQTCKEIFQEDTERWLNQVYYQVIPFQEVNQVIQTVFMTEKKQRQQVRIPIHLSVQQFEIYGAPVLSEHGG